MTFKEIGNKKNETFYSKGEIYTADSMRVIILSEISLSVRRIEWSRAWISKAICLKLLPTVGHRVTRWHWPESVRTTKWQLINNFSIQKKKYLVFLFFFKNTLPLKVRMRGEWSPISTDTRKRERERSLLFFCIAGHTVTRDKRRDNIFILFLLKFIFFLISSQNCFFFVCAVYNLCPLIAVSQCIERLFSLFIGLLILPMTRRSRWRRRK